MSYVDGYLLAVPRTKFDEYHEMARLSGEVWRELGALSFTEARVDDVLHEGSGSFAGAIAATDDEVVVLSFIVFESLEQRDSVNARVMVDPRLSTERFAAAFEGTRMISGGLRPFVEL